MKPMLAAATDGLNLAYPLMLSPKLDGVRCLIVDGVAMSRSLKPIPNQRIQRLFGHQALNGLDGELIVGNPSGEGVYQRTVSGVMGRSGSPDVKLMVFDDFLWPASFTERLDRAQQRIGRVETCEAVTHHVVDHEDDLLAHEQRYLMLGYEGVMIRSLAGPYKHGRSTLKEGWLLKLKRFADAEAEILGCQELMHNANAATTNELGHQERSSKKAGLVGMNTLGALQVRDVKTGVAFDLGTGFTAEVRKNLWLLRKTLPGKLVKYKYQPVGVKDKPRFPVFLGFRDPADM